MHQEKTPDPFNFSGPFPLFNNDSKPICTLPARLIFPQARAKLQPMNWQQRITIESDKRGGKPCIRGLRITVYDVLGKIGVRSCNHTVLRSACFKRRLTVA